ncbi:MAG TPA: tetratricopeptide repeat protein [Xanthobacteraceae bacterium]
MGGRHDEWPLRLIYGTEIAFVITTFSCILLASRLQGSPSETKRSLVAFAGGTSASFGLIMPFELAPMFFGVRGEWMMATMGLMLFYPLAAVPFVLLFAKFMKVGAPPNLRVDFLSATRCYDRGVVSLGGKNYARAIADFTDAIRYNPKYALAYLNRGVAHFDQSDYDHAIADYDQVIALNPKFAAAYGNRAEAYRAKGALDRAGADLDQAQALMRAEELQLRPVRNTDRPGAMAALAEWLNNRGGRT